MEPNEVTKEIAFRYLLGQMSEAEEARYEELYFADPDALEELQLFREELIEDYLRGDLDEAERKLFEQNFLSSPTHVQKFEITKAFIGANEENWKATAASSSLNSFAAAETSALYASDPGTGKLVTRAVDKKRGRFGSQSVSAFFRLHSRKLAWAAVVVLVGAIGFLLLRGVFDQSSVSPDKHIANDNANRINANQSRGEHAGQQNDNRNINQNNRDETLPSIKKPGEKRERLQPQIAVFLLTHSSKSSGGKQTFVIEPESTSVQFQMARITDAYKRFRASLNTTDGSQLTVQTLTPTTAHSLVLNLPAHLFSSGEYVFRLDGISDKGQREEVDKYFFRVEKKGKSN
jgi:hypothetical protein